MKLREIFFLCLGGIGLLLIPLSVSASQPRLTALGANGDFLEDDANALRWFGSLADYSPAVTADFGHFNIYHGYHDHRGSTLSGPSLAWRGNLGSGLGHGAVFWHSRDDDLPRSTLHRDFREDSFSLMYGRRLGRWQLALLAQISPETETAPAGSSQPIRFYSRQRLWGLGARVDLSPGAYLDLALNLQKNREAISFAGEPSDDSTTFLESESGLGLRGRLFLQLGRRTALIPVLEYLAENRPTPDPAVGFEPGIDGHLLRLGCGLNFFPDTDRLAYLAVDWKHGSTEYKADSLVFEVPWTNDWDALSLFAGWEHRYLPWMTLRSAVGYSMTRGDGHPPDAGESAREGFDADRLAYTLGAGFHLLGWDLDAALSESEPRPVGGDWEWAPSSYRRTFISVSLRYTY